MGIYKRTKEQQMNLILNLLWIIFGGIFIFIGYVVSGLALCITLVGIPWGLQCFKLAIFALFPFGSDTEALPYQDTNESLNLVLNIVWLIFGGLFIMLNHLVWGFMLAVSIIGIPFALQHFKLMRLAISPFGRRLT